MTHIFFDLDGTIWDASATTAAAWSDVLGRRGIKHVITDNDIRSVAGRPYLECLRRIVPAVLEHDDFPEILDELAVAEQKYMREMGGDLFPDAIESIGRLANNNQLYLVSNCNGWYLDAFFATSNLNNYFQDSICFTSMNQDKTANIRYLMDKHKIESGFFIGDTMGDKISAEVNGLKFGHAKFGFDSALASKLSFASFREITLYFESIKGKNQL